jgi:hypothetical protein
VTFAVWYYTAPAHAEGVGLVMPWLVNATFPIHVPIVASLSKVNLYR